ncbi:MAG: DMT family transporter [Candidatus Methylacidiphilales bacterium]|nr:DMT family transporter [Candidatus Methylacidiphilales bacterium]
MDRLVFLLPLFSALAYAVAALCIKRAVDLGMGPWRMAFFSNLAVWLVFLTSLFWYDPSWKLDPWWAPVAAGLLFFTGQLFTMMALVRGDVSVATPVLGSKVILVALFLELLTDQEPGWRIWVAAALTVGGIVLLQGGGLPHDRGRVWRTVLYAGASAASFSLADIVVQMWTRTIGFGLFVAVSTSVNLLASFALFPFFRAPLFDMPRGAARFVYGGVFILGLQAFALFFAIGVYGKVAESNIIYSSRGMWSVVLVWCVGHWFGNTEHTSGGGVMTRRLGGSLLILSAIVLTVL